MDESTSNEVEDKAVLLATDSVTQNLETLGARPASWKSFPSTIALRPLKPEGGVYYRVY